jgi:TonB family protein
MRFRELCSILVMVGMPAASLARTNATQISTISPLAEREGQVWPRSVHGSRFADIPHTTGHNSCGATQPPEALTTPDPILDQPGTPAKVTISFIIGTDGRVHSPFVLESAGPTKDRTVLQTVSFWRYRPAMCNGVPTEAEGKIEFSRQ